MCRSCLAMKTSTLNKCAAVLFVLILVCFAFETVEVTKKLFPEVGMVLNSQCNTPAPGWNGKLLGFKIYDNPAMHARNDSFSSYDYGSFRRLQEEPTPAPSSQNEIIIIASHHKTGTILSQKIFARVCAIMKWCCVFHVTKDSLVAVKHSLANEPVKLMGHTQWAWNPHELGVPYRFVHFYRDPYKKVASGYRYHMDGVEAWCKKPLFYGNSCKFPNRKEPTKLEIFEFCQSVHLCEPCCRMEHEARYALHRSAPSAATKHAKSVSGGAEPAYAARDQSEYDFICDHLSNVNVSLMNALETSADLDHAIRMEASIDYYENLRMARIINNTWNDPRSLNIDLDDFMASYEHSVRMILHHLNLKITARALEEIVNELNFYDIDSSPIYRYSQANPFMNHINQEDMDEKAAVRQVLAEDTRLHSFYGPIYELLDGALRDSMSSTGAKNAHYSIKSNPSSRFLFDKRLRAADAETFDA